MNTTPELPAAAVTSQAADVVNAWLSLAMTHARTLPVADCDAFTATLPPFRRFAAVAESESLALDALREQLKQHALGEVMSGRVLHVWEPPALDVPPAARALVRLSTLRRELRTRGGAWGAQRRNLPPGVVERCLAEIDAVVERHAAALPSAA